MPSADNARIYWEDVTCKLVNDNVNLYYYILQDVQWGNPSPSFGIKPGGDLAQVSPLFDLSCPAKNVSYFPTFVLPLLSPLLFTFLAELSLLAPPFRALLLPSCYPVLLQMSSETSARTFINLGCEALRLDCTG